MKCFFTLVDKTTGSYNRILPADVSIQGYLPRLDSGQLSSITMQIRALGLYIYTGANKKKKKRKLEQYKTEPKKCCKLTVDNFKRATPDGSLVDSVWKCRVCGLLAGEHAIVL